MKACYEFLYCEQKDCVRREIEDKQCWEIEGISRYEHSDIFIRYRALLEDKIDACARCSYYLIHSPETEALQPDTPTRLAPPPDVALPRAGINPS